LTGGKPFIIPPLPKQDRDAALQHATDEIMCQIAALLPERYRGVYAGQPRVKELLNESAQAAVPTAARKAPGANKT
jgi:1-acyl-sn-glycerol-3-phosphate acyltransferase